MLDSATDESSKALDTLAAAPKDALLMMLGAVTSNIATNVQLVAMLDTLAFSHRSDIVPKIAVWVSNALNKKPVMEYSTGLIGSISRPRSVINAIERICSEISNDLTGKTLNINVIYAGALEHAGILRYWAARNLNWIELFRT